MAARRRPAAGMHGPPSPAKKQRRGPDPNLAFIRLNQAITGCRSADALLELMEAKGDGFNDINMSTAIHRLGSRFAPFFEQRREPGAGLRKVMGLAVLGISRGDLGPRSLANVAWGLARMGVYATELFAAIARETPYRVFEFGPQDLANVAWAFAKADVDAPALFEAVAAAVPARVDGFTTQHLSSTAWAFAKAEARADGLYDALAAAALRRLPQFVAIDVANTAWAFSRQAELHGRDDAALFRALADHVLPRLAACSPQHVSAIAAAFAAAGGACTGDVLAAIAAHAPKRIHDFNAAELSTLVCASARRRPKRERRSSLGGDRRERSAPRYARADHAAPALFRAVGGAAPQRISAAFAPDVLMATLRAFVKMSVPAPDLLDAIAHSMGRKYDRYARADCSEVAIRCAELGVACPHLMHNVVKHSEDHFRDFSVADLERFDLPILWQLVANATAKFGVGDGWGPRELLRRLEAFHRADVDNADFYAALCDAARDRLAAFPPGDLANFVAALARARVSARLFFDAAADHATARIDDFEPNDLVQLAWAYSTACVVAPNLLDAINAAGPRKLARKAAADP